MQLPRDRIANFGMPPLRWGYFLSARMASCQCSNMPRKPKAAAVRQLFSPLQAAPSAFSFQVPGEGVHCCTCTQHELSAFGLFKGEIVTVKQPSVLDSVVHALCKSIVQWVSRLSHTDSYVTVFQHLHVFIRAVL